jgi:hypothetical protein
MDFEFSVVVCTNPSTTFSPRSVIETVNDELKNICQVEHTRHRSLAGFILNIMSAIAAYSFFPKKPSIKNDIEETNPSLIAQLNQPKLLAA